MSWDLSKPFSSTMTAGIPAFDMVNMPEMRNALFRDKEITLDGWRFIGCKLQNCRIHVSSLFFVLDHCEIDNDCVVFFQGESVKIIQLWNKNSDWVRENYPAWAPRHNIDGTISIGG